MRTSKKKTKKVTKKKAKKVAKKKEFSLTEISSDLDKFEIRIMSDESNKSVDEVPYRIPFS
jgi:hypothetical protein